MINLMYVVLMAMLALNISSEVLNGFSIVEESLNRTTANSSKENEVLYNNFAEQMNKNPQKVKEWFEKATAVKRMSDSLYNLAQALKVQIVREADGKDGNIYDIKSKDNLEAASHVMLAPGTGQGKSLYDAINTFRERILKMVTDPHQRKIIESNLTTKVPKSADTLGKNWQEYMFEDMPVAGAVTLLSKLQSDVRYAEGEVLHTLVANIDMKDIRVNKLSAFVIPESKTVISGDQFSGTDRHGSRGHHTAARDIRRRTAHQQRTLPLHGRCRRRASVSADTSPCATELATLSAATSHRNTPS